MIATIRFVHVVALVVLFTSAVRGSRVQVSVKHEVLPRGSRKMDYADFGVLMLQKQTANKYCMCLKAFHQASPEPPHAFKQPQQVALFMDAMEHPVEEIVELESFNDEFAPSKMDSMANHSDPDAVSQSPAEFERMVLERVVVPLAKRTGKDLAAVAETIVANEKASLRQTKNECMHEVDLQDESSMMTADQILGCCHDLLTSRLSPLADQTVTGGVTYRTIRMTYPGHGEPIIDVSMNSAGPDATYKITTLGHVFTGRALLINSGREQEIGGLLYLLNVFESGKNAEIVLQGTEGTATDGYCIVRNDGRELLQGGRAHDSIASVESALEGFLMVAPVDRHRISDPHGWNSRRCSALSDKIARVNHDIRLAGKHTKEGEIHELRFDHDASASVDTREMMDVLGTIGREGDVEDPDEAWRTQSHEVQVPDIEYEELMRGVRERVEARRAARQPRRGSVYDSLIQLDSSEDGPRLPRLLRMAFNLLWGTVKTLAYTIKYTVSWFINKILKLGLLNDLTKKIRRFSRDPQNYMYIPRLYFSISRSIGRDFGEIGTGRPFYRLCRDLGKPFGMDSKDMARLVLVHGKKPSFYKYIKVGLVR